MLGLFDDMKTFVWITVTLGIAFSILFFVLARETFIRVPPLWLAATSAGGVIAGATTLTLLRDERLKPTVATGEGSLLRLLAFAGILRSIFPWIVTGTIFFLAAVGHMH
jgi:cytochrome bd-type quinol oxidase subunit 2